MNSTAILIDCQNIIKLLITGFLDFALKAYWQNPQFYNCLLITAISGTIAKKFEITIIHIIFRKFLGLSKRALKFIQNLFDLKDCIENLNSKL